MSSDSEKLKQELEETKRNEARIRIESESLLKQAEELNQEKNKIELETQLKEKAYNEMIEKERKEQEDLRIKIQLEIAAEKRRRASEVKAKNEAMKRKKEEIKKLSEDIERENQLLDIEATKNLELETLTAKNLSKSTQKIAREQAILEMEAKNPKHPFGCMCKKCKNEAKKRAKQTAKNDDKLYGNDFKSKLKSAFSVKQKKDKRGKSIDLETVDKFQTKLDSFDKEIQPIDAKIHPNKFTDVAILGLRLAVGISFIVHGFSKLDGNMFASMLQSWGVPVELATTIAVVEILAGIFLSIGFLSRIGSVMISVIMLGAIFVVKGAATLIGEGGVELDVIILGAVAVIGIFGPGRLSLANVSLKGRIFARFLQ